MVDYAIGDIQGCYDGLMRLLDHVSFNEKRDKLWFVGDLVNRGSQSLQVLRFIKGLPLTPQITLGNHDLHLLNLIFNKEAKHHKEDTLNDILIAHDREELGHWLRRQSILIHDSHLNIVVCHAGIAPMWDLNEAKSHAKELEEALSGQCYQDFLKNMYGNEPNIWDQGLQGMVRLRVICNYFTRMRFCDKEGRLELKFKGAVKEATSNLFPWYLVPNRKEIMPGLIFGHWAALEGICPHPNIYAIDTGYVWGGYLTALRIQDMKRFVVGG